jgi:hypothetical protein
LVEAAADAQGREALLGIALDHLVQERHEHARAGGADRVAESDRAAVDVDLVVVGWLVPAQILVDRARLGGECLIEFDQVELIASPAGLLERLVRSRRRTHTHDRRVDADGRKADDARERFQPERLGAVGGHHQQCRRAVVEAGCVAGGDRSLLVERGPESRERFGVGLPIDELVRVEHQWIALALRNADRNDLFLEPPGVLCRGRLGLRRQRQCILRRTIDRMRLSDVFGGVSHVVLVVDVPQAVDDHAVDDLGIAHAEAITRAEHHMR